MIADQPPSIATPPPLKLRSDQGWTPAYTPSTNQVSRFSGAANPFTTPLLDKLFPQAPTGSDTRLTPEPRPQPDSSRSGIAVPKGGERKLEVTVIDVRSP